MITFDLPWPPSLNAYYRHVGPRVLISKAGRLYREEVCLMGLPRAPEGRIAMSVVTHQRTAGRCDLDNFLKVALDSMKWASVFADDSLIDELCVRRGCVERAGRLRVRIRAFDPESTLALQAKEDW